MMLSRHQVAFENRTLGMRRGGVPEPGQQEGCEENSMVDIWLIFFDIICNYIAYIYILIFNMYLICRT